MGLLKLADSGRQSGTQFSGESMSVRIGLFMIAALLTAAHFLRLGSYLLLALCLASPLLFFVKKRWSLLVLQCAAYVATANWVWIAWQLVAVRQPLGRPWLAAVVILGGVALVTLAAGLLLNSRCLREHYPSD